MKALFALIRANLHGLRGLLRREVHRTVTVGHYNRYLVFGVRFTMPLRHTLIACHDCGHEFHRDEQNDADRALNKLSAKLRKGKTYETQRQEKSSDQNGA